MTLARTSTAGARRPTGARRPAELHSVFERTLHEQRRALAGWSAGLGTLAAVLLAFFPTLRGNESIAKLLEAYPKAFREMFAIADFTTGPGYLRSEVFSLTGPLLVVILAVLWGSDVVAGEEERGTVDVLLANPVSRRRVLVEKSAAVATGVVLVTGFFGVVLWLGGLLVGLDVGAEALVAALISTALLALVFATLALLVAAGTGKRGLARGVAAAVAVASYLVSSLASLVGWLRPARPFSPWYHAIGVDPIGNGFEPWHLALLAGLALAFVALAVAAYDRRDLGIS